MLADLEAPMLDQRDVYSDALTTAVAHIARRDHR
jgi:hypothetical protein